MICLIDSKRNNTTTRFNRIRLQSLRFYCSFNYFTCEHSVHYIFYSFFFGVFVLRTFDSKWVKAQFLFRCFSSLNCFLRWNRHRHSIMWCEHEWNVNGCVLSIPPNNDEQQHNSIHFDRDLCFPIQIFHFKSVAWTKKNYSSTDRFLMI